MLAQSFAEQLAPRHGPARSPPSAPDDGLLRTYSWPGNVRELRNVIERALIISPDGALRLERILPESAPDAAIPAPLIPEPAEGSPGILDRRRLRHFERNNMLAALEKTGWRVGGENGAAALVGISPSTFKSRMKALDIRRPRP